MVLLETGINEFIDPILAEQSLSASLTDLEAAIATSLFTKT